MQKDPETISVEIQSFSSKGYGIASVPSGEKIEIAHSLPGDTLLVEWRRKKYPPQKGRIVEITNPSLDRIDPPCVHAATCGGCSWQQMNYVAQLREKEKRVFEAFQGNHFVSPIIPSPLRFGYRNKMEFTFSQNRAGTRYLGLMIAQAEPYVFSLQECHLGPTWFQSVVAEVRKWWEASSISAYNGSNDTGVLRYLTLRNAEKTKGKMVILNLSGRSEETLSRQDIDQFVVVVREAAGEDVSIFLRIHQTKKGRPTQFYEMHLNGSDHLVETLRIGDKDFSFKISPVSFFQPNTLQAERLYTEVMKRCQGAQLVYDLYCGTGTLGMAVSSFASEVVGVELSPEAVLDAKENLRMNQIENMSVFQKDVGKWIQEMMNSPSFKRPDAVILDPPRAGLDPIALDCLKKILPSKIVYVSCNPVSQAENIRELVMSGYKIIELQPLDQFPHTYHIENIALLERNG